MGAEQLEEDEVEPMFAGLEDSLGGKKIALFGDFPPPVDATIIMLRAGMRFLSASQTSFRIGV